MFQLAGDFVPSIAVRTPAGADRRHRELPIDFNSIAPAGPSMIAF